MSEQGISWVELATGRRQPAPETSIKLCSGDAWKGLRLLHNFAAGGEHEDAYALGHLVFLHVGEPLDVDTRRGAGQWPIRLDTGSISILPARVPCRSRWTGTAESIVVELAPELLSAAHPNRTEAVDLRAIAGVQDPFIERTVRALHEDVRAGCPFGPGYGESMGVALAAHLVRWHSDFVQRPLHSARVPATLIAQVREFIEDNLERDLPLHALAELVRADVFALSRSFKQALGASPHRYIVTRRIERAKELLAEPKLPIADIALRCGFASQSNFADAFRRLVKVSPRAYRNLLAR
jgi:AraC family transcriptional regulator